MHNWTYACKRCCLLFLLLSIVLVAKIRADTDDKNSACFFVVTARDKPLPPSAAKRLADATKERDSGAISEEQFEKRRRAITKDTPLVLLGYFEGKALALELRRENAAERNWSTSRPPQSLRFDRPLRFPSSGTLFGTPSMALPREGWSESSCGNDSLNKYQVHPWDDAGTLKAVSVVFPCEIKDVIYRPARTQTIRTSLGSRMNVGSVPEAWVVTLIVRSDDERSIEGLFQLESIDGVVLGQAELPTPASKGRPVPMEIVVSRRLATDEKVQLRSIAALARWSSPSEETTRKETGGGK